MDASEHVHVEVALVLEPALLCLDAECSINRKEPVK